MVKTIYNYGPPMSPPLGDIPPPPPLPKYDPNEEAPKWDWHRIWWHMPKMDRDPERPMRKGEVAVADDKPDWRGVIKNNVMPLPPVEPYNIGRPNDPKYFYFDTPDYADPFKKLWWSFKFFTRTGLMLACTAGILYNRKFKWETNRELLSRIVLPWLAGGMVFSTAAITTANLRGNKDDMYNYFAGGLVTGAALGRKNYLSHIRQTVCWTAGGMFVKYNAETNGNMALVRNPRNRSYGIAGLSAEGGFWTGNLHFIPSHPNGDPGRDTKRLTV